MAARSSAAASNGSSRRRPNSTYMDELPAGATPSEKFVESCKSEGAAVCALSALLTTTMPQMTEVVKAIKDAGIDVKTIIGGAPVTQSYADEIGADGYAADAASAADVAKQLMGV